VILAVLINGGRMLVAEFAGGEGDGVGPPRGCVG